MAKLSLSITMSNGSIIDPAFSIADTDLPDFFNYWAQRLSIDPSDNNAILAKWFGNMLIDSMTPVAQWRKEQQDAKNVIVPIAITPA